MNVCFRPEADITIGHVNDEFNGDKRPGADIHIVAPISSDAGIFSQLIRYQAANTVSAAWFRSVPG